MSTANGSRSQTNCRTSPLSLGGLIMITALLVATGCTAQAAPIDSPVTEDQVTEMARNALEAFNSGDYEAWSRDWSDPMKAAIGEDAFLAFRDDFRSQLGDYREISAVTGSQGSDPGTYRWTFDVEFDKGPFRVWFGFKKGSTLVEGISFEDPAA